MTSNPSLFPLLSSTISTISLVMASSSGLPLLPSVSLLEVKLNIAGNGEVLRAGVGLWSSCIYGASCTFQSPFSTSSDSLLPSSQPPLNPILPFSSTLFLLLLLAILTSSIQLFVNLFLFLASSQSSSPAKKLSRDIGLIGGVLSAIFIAILSYPSVSLHWSSIVGNTASGSVAEARWRVVGPGSATNLVVLAGVLLIWGGRERGSISTPSPSPNDLESSVPMEKKDLFFFTPEEVSSR